MKKSVMLLLGLAMVLSSCVYSLFPIYTEDTLVFEKNFIGRWSNGDYIMVFEPAAYVSDINLSFESDNYLVFKGDTIRDARAMENALSSEIQKVLDKNQKGYRLTIIEQDNVYSYEAHLIKLKGEYYMDLYPSEMDDPGNIKGQISALLTNAVPVHTFYKIRLREDNFELVHFNLEALNDLFRKNQIRLRHELIDEDEVLITAQSKEIQKFIEQYTSDPKVFGEVEMFTKI